MYINFRKSGIREFQGGACRVIYTIYNAGANLKRNIYNINALHLRLKIPEFPKIYLTDIYINKFFILLAADSTVVDN